MNFDYYIPKNDICQQNMNYFSNMNGGSYMDNEQIVNSIKTLCKEHDITITKLEEELHMSQGLISRWSKSDPSLSKIIDIANYFKISLDELARYKTSSDDEFINLLISQTSDGILRWNNYNNKNSIPKQFNNNYAKDMFDGKNGKGYYKFLLGQETSFYTCIKNGYISLYSYHQYKNSKKFATIILFIQADDNSELIDQRYSTEQLIPLWLKVLSSLHEEAPDDIKAEELKFAFISENNKKANSDYTENKNIDPILTGAALEKLIESINIPELENFKQTISSPEFQKLQQTVSSPEFQKAIHLANKMQQSLSTIPIPFTQKED